MISMISCAVASALLVQMSDERQTRASISCLTESLIVAAQASDSGKFECPGRDCPGKTQRDAEYKAASAKADANYKSRVESCKAKSGNDKDVCMKEAKAAHGKLTGDANAKRKSAAAMADGREDRMEAQYGVAKGKCEAMLGPARDACIRDTKSKYRQ